MLLRASSDQRIKSVITWAGVSGFENRFPQGIALQKWKIDGVRYILNGRTKQNMPHYYSFYEDFVLNKDILNIENAVKNLAIPQLIIHGEQDEAVNISEAKMLNKWNPNAMFVQVNSGHTFGSSHPWAKDQLPSELNHIVVKTISFIK